MEPKKSVSRFAIVIFALLLMGSFVAILVTADFAPRLSCYADSTLVPGLFDGSNACDNTANQWISASSAYPHFVIVNLTGMWQITNVSIVTNNYAAQTGRIDIWNGVTWVAYKNFTNGMTLANQTIPLDTLSIPTNAIRIFGLTSNGSEGSPLLMGANEIWPQGTLFIPPTTECYGLGSVGLAISTLLPILIGIGILLAFVGFFLSVQSGKSGGRGMSMGSFVFGIIGIVVFVFIVTALIVLIPAC